MRIVTDKGKQVIQQIDEIPRFFYPVTGSLLALVNCETAFNEFSSHVRRDLESALSGYIINANGVLRKYHSTLYALDILEHADDLARERLRIIRSLHDKPASNFTAGLIGEAILDARRSAHGEQGSYAAAVANCCRQLLDRLPWSIVGEDLKQLKASIELQNEAVYDSMVRTQIEPAAIRAGGISQEVAQLLIQIRFNITMVLPVRAELSSALGHHLALNAVENRDIWTDRSLILSDDELLTPVVIGVWDSGVDIIVFRGQLATSNGRCGIAWDLDGRPSPYLLYPLTMAQRLRYIEIRSILRGYLDMQAARETEDAHHLKSRISSLRPEDVRPFLEDLTLISNYIHGTHVAGIALCGNPAARLLVSRITWDHSIITKTPSEDVLRAQVAAYQETVKFFSQGNTRIVNISWNRSYAIYDHDFDTDSSNTSTERKKRARALFEMDQRGLHEAISSHPEILFVVAAGNSNRNASFNRDFPSCFSLPNLLCVGGAGRDGSDVSFGSFGPQVTVCANSVDVDSLVPGDDIMALSGTSMAAPHVTNIAAKLVALRPSLSPIEIIRLIRDGANVSTDGQRHLVNPRKCYSLLMQSQSCPKQPCS